MILFSFVFAELSSFNDLFKYSVKRSSFLSTGFYEELQRFNQGFWLWLNQMASNQRGFSPFTLEINNDEIFNSVKGIPLKRSNWKGTKNYERFTEYLNKSLKEDNSAKTKEKRIMEIFYCATESLIQVK